MLNRVTCLLGATYLPALEHLCIRKATLGAVTIDCYVALNRCAPGPTYTPESMLVLAAICQLRTEIISVLIVLPRLLILHPLVRLFVR